MTQFHSHAVKPVKTNYIIRNEVLVEATVLQCKTRFKSTI